MDITRAAIRNNRVTTVAVLVLVFGGIAAYNTMSRAMDPGFIIRTAQIMTIFPGASPERVEQLVTDPIEKAVQELPELDFVASTSKTGVSVVMVNIKEKYTDVRPIWDRLRRKIADMEGDLPDGVVGPTVNDDFGDTYGIVISLSGDGLSYRQLEHYAEEVREELLRIEEVAKVQLVGTQSERIFVEYRNSKLAQLGISPMQLQGILQARNIIIPGGEVSTGDETIVLEPSGNFESLDELRRTVIRLPGRRELITLEQIATVRRDYVDPPQQIMRTSHETARGRTIGLGVSLRDGGNLIVLGDKVTALVRQLQSTYPHGLDFNLVAFQPKAVEDKVNDFVMNVVQSVLIVLAVMLLTLGLRTGFLVASLIPTTMVAALLVMSTLDIGLDQVSLASLIIALGMLVDNAIVMSESIMVRIDEGAEPVEAAVASAKELRVPLLTSSLTTAAAFLPIFLAESMVGEYTNPLFKVVTIALLCSWGLALTMIPMLCVWVLGSERTRRRRKEKQAKRNAGGESRWIAAYRDVLIKMLRRRFISLGGAVAVFVIAMMGFALVPKLFFPIEKEARFTATLKLPIGSPIEKTSEVIGEIEAYMRAELLVGPGRTKGITDWAVFIGQGAPRYVLGYNPEPPAPEYAYMIINTTDADVVDDLMGKLEAYANRFPDLQPNIKRLSAGPPVNNPIEVRLSSRSDERLFAMVKSVKEYLGKDRRVKNIVDNRGTWTKKLEVQVVQPRAQRAGVSSQDIAVSLLTGLSGFEISQYREDNKIIPITLRSVEADRKDLGKLESLNVYAQASGANVPLSQVANPPKLTMGPAKILRRNRLRTVTVSTQLAPGVTAAEVNADLLPWLQKQPWPVGDRFELGGEAESSDKGNASIAAKMPIALLLILLLLVLQFNSLRRTAIILFTIPMALIGVVFGLLVARSYFGFMTLLGVVSLAGIVINNAIVLLERIQLEIDENGFEPQRAVIEAAQRRARPILLTTATTIGGLLPLWFGGGMFEPMAIAIIFGLLFSTVLTLGVVPVLYSILFRVSYRDYTHES